MLGTKEHQEIMAQFEKQFKGFRFDKEAKSDWKRGIIYQDGKTNELFGVFRSGYAFGKAVERMEAA